MDGRVAHKLITELYDVYRQPDGWHNWLAYMAEFVGAQHAALHPANRAPAADITVAVDQETLLIVQQSPRQPLNKSRIEMLLPHVRRVWKIEQETHLRALPPMQIAEHVLSLFGLSVIVLQDTTVVYMNFHARKLMETTGVFAVNCAQLSLPDQDNNARLSSALRKLQHKSSQLCTLKNSRHARTIDTQVFVLCQTLSSHRGPDLVVLYSVDQADGQGLQPLQIAHLAARYGLTEKETRLVSGLANGNTMKELAVELHVSIHTLRVQLKSVFRKTNTHRQSALINLVLHEVPLLYQPAQYE